MSKTPNPAELRAYLKRHNLGSGQAARLAGVDRSKFRLYMIDKGKKGHQPIPFSVWYTLTDIVSNTPPDKLQQLAKKPKSQVTAVFVDEADSIPPDCDSLGWVNRGHP